YAVAYKLTDGVYQVTAIDEDDADGATRARYCRRADESPCRISTQKELFAFARATDARQKEEGALVLRLPTDNSEPLRYGRRWPRARFPRPISLVVSARATVRPWLVRLH